MKILHQWKGGVMAHYHLIVSHDQVAPNEMKIDLRQVSQ